MVNNEELAKYIYEEISDLRWKSRGELFNQLTADALEFWIQQFKIKDACGHSEWSERFQQNIWIEDD